MRPSLLLFCLLFELLCVVPLVCCSKRSVLLSVGSEHPPGLAQLCINVLHSLPRYNNAPNTIANISSTDIYNSAKPYVEGLALPLLLPFAFAFFVYITCFSFCSARCCCNCCGRFASVGYSPSQGCIKGLKATLILMVAITTTLFALGIVSNAGLSRTLDRTFTSSDSLVEAVYRPYTPFHTLVQAAQHAQTQVEAINTSFHQPYLPTLTQLNSYSTCLNAVYSYYSMQNSVFDSLLLLSGNSSLFAPSYATVTWDMIAQTINATANAAASWPNNTNIGNLFQTYSQSLSAYFPSTSSVSTLLSYFSSSSLLSASLTSSFFTSFSLLPSSPSSTPPTSLSDLNNTLAAIKRCQTTIQDANALYNAILNNQSSIDAAVVQRLSVSVESYVSFDVSVLQQLDTERANFAANFITFYNYILQINSSIVSLTSFNVSLLSSLLTRIPVDLSNIVEPPSLRSQLIAVQQSAADLGNIQQITKYFNKSSVLVSSLGSVTLSPTGLNGSLALMSATINQLNCWPTVIKAFQRMNDKLFQFLPPIQRAIDQRSFVYQQAGNQQQIQQDIAYVRNSLKSYSNSFQSMPNLTSLYFAYAQLNSTLSRLPNLTNIISQLAQFADQLAQFPSTQPLVQSIPSFQADVINVNNTLSALLSVCFQPLYTSLLSISRVSLFAYSSSLVEMSTAVQLVKPLLTTLINNQTINDTLRTSLLQSITRYINAYYNVSNITIFSNFTSNYMKLYQLSDIILNLKSQLSSAQQSQLNTTLTNQISGSLTSSSALLPLLSPSAWYQLQANLASIQDSTNQQAQIRTIAQKLRANSSAVLSLLPDLIPTSAYMSSSDYAAWNSSIASLIYFQPLVPDFSSILNQFQNAVDGLDQADSQMKSYRHNYYVARQKTAVFKNHIDWLRLLGYMLLLFIPVLMTLCGIGSWIREKGSLSMYMSMCTFAVMGAFFIATSVHMLPSILFADQCNDLQRFLSVNLEQFSLSNSSTTPYINMSSSTTGKQLFDYYSLCATERPYLLSVFANASDLITRNNFDFNVYRDSIRQALNTVNNAVQTNAYLNDIFNQIQQDTYITIDSSSSVYSLTNCSSVSTAWSSFQSSLCGADGFTGAAALITCICFLIAVCTTPLVCVGIAGYKRFDKRNWKNSDDHPAALRNTFTSIASIPAVSSDSSAAPHSSSVAGVPTRRVVPASRNPAPTNAHTHAQGHSPKLTANPALELMPVATPTYNYHQQHTHQPSQSHTHTHTHPSHVPAPHYPQNQSTPAQYSLNSAPLQNQNTAQNNDGHFYL